MVFLIRQSNSKIICMIRKNIPGLCLLAILSLFSCKKDELKPKQAKANSSLVVSHSDKVYDSVKGSLEKESDNNTENEGPEAPKPEASKNTVEGTFVANTCDGGRFSIELKNMNGKPAFKILDKGKVIAAGNVSTETDEKTGEITSVAMGEIGGLYEGDKIIIQNYGNAMNEFDHFTQCGDKYLEFTKSK